MNRADLRCETILPPGPTPAAAATDGAVSEEVALGTAHERDLDPSDPRDAELVLDQSLYELTVEPVRYETAPPKVRRLHPRTLPPIEILDDAETDVCDAATINRLRAQARASHPGGAVAPDDLDHVLSRVVG